MNSIAQQAVPNGKGQNELRCAQSSRASNLVVTQLSPTILSIDSLLSRGTESTTSCDYRSQAIQVAEREGIDGGPAGVGGAFAPRSPPPSTGPRHSPTLSPGPGGGPG